MEKIRANREAAAGAAIGLTVAAAAATYYVIKRSNSRVRPNGKFPLETLPNDAYDAVIVGAGPSGSTCAHFLASAGARVALLDKETFPRDKYCGDAVRLLSVSMFKRL
jgi:NADPH-dependent 2,4-dienoyl-CoA reductase/sulfur reductase-like enzyme